MQERDTLQGRMPHEHFQCPSWTSTRTVIFLYIIEFACAFCKANPFQLSKGVLDAFRDP
jgi:hypothetical protein